MSTKSLQKQNLFHKYLEDIARDFFLYSICFGNIFINVKDVIFKPEVRAS